MNQEVKHSKTHADIYDPYKADDDPIALIRAQHRLEFPWVAEKIRRHIGYHAEVLDMGCGAGFLPNDLANLGHRVTAMDLSSECLKMAAAKDRTHSVKYLLGDVYQMPFAAKSFDVVTAMDLLEHVSDPQQVLLEASRVLRPGGVFIYNTWNRHPFAWLMAVKGIEWLVQNSPKDYHAYQLFIPPQTLSLWLADSGMDPLETCGVRPIIWQRACWNLWRSGRVDETFRFCFVNTLSAGYVGCAKKLKDH